LHIPTYLLPGWFFIAATGCALAALLTALRSAHWQALLDEPGRMHLVAGGAVACLLLWLLNIRLVDGQLIMHFLGVTTLTLVVGWSFCVLAGSAALVGFFLLKGLAWEAYPVSLLLTVLVPATLTRLLARLLYRPRLRHPFIYILGAGFAGGGLVVLAIALVSVTLFALAGLDGWVAAALEWWPLVFLIMFSEAFINGMCVSALAIFHPDAMKTFDDRFYLDESI
jgi:uncharacterized membrane protein